MITWHLIVHKAVIQMKQNKLALIFKEYLLYMKAPKC